MATEGCTWDFSGFIIEKLETPAALSQGGSTDFPRFESGTIQYFTIFPLSLSGSCQAETSLVPVVIGPVRMPIVNPEAADEDLTTQFQPQNKDLFQK